MRSNKQGNSGFSTHIAGTAGGDGLGGWWEYAPAYGDGAGGYGDGNGGYGESHGDGPTW